MDLTTAIDELRLILQSQDVNFDDASDILELSIKNAVDKYSRDMPQTALVDLAGNGTQVLDFPSTFTYDFSVIQQVEYPVDDTSADKTYLDAGDDYNFYRKPNGTLQILMVDATPEDASDPVRVTYTNYIDTISDVFANYTRAVLQLSAYYACLSEAMKAANTTSDGEGLDFVDHVTTSSRYEQIGEKFLKNYEKVLFGDSESAQRLGVTVAVSAREQWSTSSRFNTPRIFHVDD